MAYAAAYPVPAARPALSLGCYPAWDPARPGHTLAAETGTGVRGGGERKHTWWPSIERRAHGLVAGLGVDPVVSGWYAVPYLASLAGAGGQVAGLPVAVRDQVENKGELGRILRAAGVPWSMVIAARTYTGRLPELARLRREVGSHRLVVQAAHAAGGRGTVFVDDARDMERAAGLAGPWRVSAFVPGPSSNVTVLSVPDGCGGVRVYVDRPSHKAIGVAAVGIGAAKSAGNDWSVPWPAADVSAVVDAAVRVGVWAWETHRMTGLWGLDCIWSESGPVINEINARKQGTTEVSGVNQQLAGFPPLVTAHLAVQLGVTPTWLPAAEEFNTVTVAAASGGELGPYYLKVRARGAVRAREDFPGSGIYRLSGERLVWAHPGAHPAQADSDAGCVLIANAPEAGTACESGAELGTVEGLTRGPGSPFAGPGELSARGWALLGAFDQWFIVEEGTL
ncbi:hypothetical protein ACFRAO_45015 [Streptomyces sp. NPDC056656]|uniref:hypothetical protein n=1 Tax=Streptomyces sp. NPDC056656 TaxID=3345895 RepID=UPI00369666A2